ncbi:uncharacterized protein PGTG_22296 [Puccinia graminis f. sp. tritici CRL 75-36-700-3]|uniref:Uncharacterized protein n=1 Tax=Puccinia graminis f. sp. tritici (strain CRL 75-36-700-3 / race SCCL) TaxID=418459 RepID=H6QU16_PUCGT|nr:uncharacterized protein PGTG_22296 [Puccinia graminis f. sp. tritici CRL 75-36-700-3]EHS64425.1 hypothetical protein PGTG_22296 [Puccinia graminis f. sp. tritici CRL 75-36-700-3]
MPMVTSSATHSYRYTDNGGMELFSGKGKLDVLERRVYPEDMMPTPERPT